MEPERRDRHDNGSIEPAGQPASQEDQRKIIRAALSKPLNLTMLFIGGVFFAINPTWWIIPLTLVTYILLVVLAARDPLYRRKVLGEGDVPTSSGVAGESSGISPERRARWLPRGETRNTVEKALVAYRKLVAAVEGSGEVARTVLDDAVPKLHATAERLVQVAHEREKAAEAVRELDSHTDNDPDEERKSIRQELESKIGMADEEISGTYERLLTLRTRMVGASLNSEVENRVAASELNRSLDELNFRLEALSEISTEPRNTSPKNNDA
jgi:hypothetical protein